MSDPLYSLILLVMLSVVVVLAIGIGRFGQGGIDGARRSNKMMQLRIALQAVAVVLIVLYVWLRSGGG